MKNKSVDEFDALFVKNSKVKKSNQNIKYFAMIFIALLVLITLIYTFVSISVVNDRMKLEQKQAAEVAKVNPLLIDQLKEKAWIESRLKMAAGDSIGLSIDLTDHSIQLELKGVIVMKSKIRDISYSGFFKRIDGNVYFSMFGSPMTIEKFESSIEKNKFKVIQAPKNEAEADANATKKDSVIKEDVYWTVKLNQDIDLNIQGIDSIADSKSNYKLGQGFQFNRNLKNISNSLYQMIRFKKPNYTPEILISIPESEAKSILEALPRNALVTIRI